MIIYLVIYNNKCVCECVCAAFISISVQIRFCQQMMLRVKLSIKEKKEKKEEKKLLLYKEIRLSENKSIWTKYLNFDPQILFNICL